MKKIILLLLLLFSLNLHAQKVAGVRMGTTYESCKTLLDNRFNGGRHSYQSTANMLAYNDVQFANQTFDYGIFNFQSDGYRTYLNEIVFIKIIPIENPNVARMIRDNLVDLYKDRYDTYDTWLPKGDFRCYEFYNESDPEQAHCNIITSYEHNKKKIMLQVHYGPVSYFEDDI